MTFQRKRLIIAARLLITLASLWYFFTLFEVSEFVTTLGSLDPALFSISLLFIFGRNYFAAWRWKLLLSARGFAASIGTLTRYYFIGMFFNFFMPTSIGGDLARGYYIYTDGAGKLEAAGAILYERIIGIVVLAAMASATIPFMDDFKERSEVTALVWGVFAALVFIMVALAYGSRIMSPERLRRWEGSLPGKAGSLFRETVGAPEFRGLLTTLIALTVVYQFIGVFSAYFLALAMGDATPFTHFIALLPLVWLISMIPITINGLGLREASIVVLFNHTGTDISTAASLSLLLLFLGIVQALLGGAFYMTNK